MCLRCQFKKIDEMGCPRMTFSIWLRIYFIFFSRHSVGGWAAFWEVTSSKNFCCCEEATKS